MLQNLFNGVMKTQFGVFFTFPTNILNIHNFYTSVTPKVGLH
jgi:hypothetical protein